MAGFTAWEFWVRCALAASVTFVIVSIVMRRRRLSLAHLRARRASAVLVVLCVVVAAPCSAGALSKYRDVEFGSSLATVSRQTGMAPEQAKVLQTRPESIQELEWRPQPLGPSTKAEAVKSVVFTFFNGQLFRMTVEYDRYQTEGMTDQDMIDAISGNFGPSVRPSPDQVERRSEYGDRDELIARWADDLQQFELIRSPYGPTYRLVGVTRTLDQKASVASVEAARLDANEAPSREAAKAAREDAESRRRLEESRAVNRPKFKP